jgi:hypothetical protein
VEQVKPATAQLALLCGQCDRASLLAGCSAGKTNGRRSHNVVPFTSHGNFITCAFADLAIQAQRRPLS